MSRPALFLDRDGVVNIDYGYVHNKENFHFVDGIFELVAAAKRLGYLVFIVTNQAGIGRGYYTEADFFSLMTWVRNEFVRNGGDLDDVYFCPYHPRHGIGEYLRESPYRKPEPGMLLQAKAEWDVDMAKSIMVGDKPSDMAAALAAGVQKRFCLGAETLSDSYGITNLREVIPFLRI